MELISKSHLVKILSLVLEVEMEELMECFLLYNKVHSDQLKILKEGCLLKQELLLKNHY
jgi:hypothetical protein